MHLTVWRICHRNYRKEAFTGEGARIYGGRFNSPGHTAVYTSGTLSLALLELLVRQQDRRRLGEMITFRVTVQSDFVETLQAEELPDGWDVAPYGRQTREIGDRWLKNRPALALRVPSAVVPYEYNCLLNPAHPAFDELSIQEMTDFSLDPRLK